MGEPKWPPECATVALELESGGVVVTCKQKAKGTAKLISIYYYSSTMHGFRKQQA